MNMQSSGTATITFSELRVPTCPLSQARVIPVLIFYINYGMEGEAIRYYTLCQSIAWGSKLITYSMFNMLNVLRPFGRLFPQVPKPPAPLSVEQRTMFTAVALLVYLICSQIPIYGIERSHDSDPLYWARIIMASSRGSLMEFGISPIISASWIGQILVAIGLMKINSKADQRDASALESVFALIFCFGEVAGAIWYGAYGQPSEMSIATMALIVAQLMGAGVIVILLDDLLSKGYGLGSGISLFIVANTSETIFWFAFSPVTMTSEFGVEFQGAFIALIHFLFTKHSVWEAIVQAFTRQHGFNLSQLFGAFFVFLVLVYLQYLSANVEFISQRYPGYVHVVNIKLFFTSTISVILQSMVISKFYKISQILHERFYKSALIKLIGTWQQDKITGGLLWYISAPYDMREAITYPHRTILYTIFVCSICAMFSKFWIVISKTTPRHYAKYIRAQQLTLRNYKEKSVIQQFNEIIPTAAMLGGVVIGFMTVLSDLLDVAGSGTGIMLSITILYGYYEKMSPTQKVLEQF